MSKVSVLDHKALIMLAAAGRIQMLSVFFLQGFSLLISIDC